VVDVWVNKLIVFAGWFCIIDTFGWVTPTFNDFSLFKNNLNNIFAAHFFNDHL
jgi:hypothetical protein